MAFNPLGKSFILVIQLLRYCLHTLVVRVVLRPFHLKLGTKMVGVSQAVFNLLAQPGKIK